MTRELSQGEVKRLAEVFATKAEGLGWIKDPRERLIDQIVTIIVDTEMIVTEAVPLSLWLGEPTDAS